MRIRRVVSGIHSRHLVSANNERLRCRHMKAVRHFLNYVISTSNLSTKMNRSHGYHVYQVWWPELLWFWPIARKIHVHSYIEETGDSNAPGIIFSASMTYLPVSHHGADNFCLYVRESMITHCSPATVVVNFKTTFSCTWPINQSYCSHTHCLYVHINI